MKRLTYIYTPTWWFFDGQKGHLHYKIHTDEDEHIIQARLIPSAIGDDSWFAEAGFDKEGNEVAFRLRKDAEGYRQPTRWETFKQKVLLYSELIKFVFSNLVIQKKKTT